MKICLVFPSDKFLSGIGYYGIRLANSLMEDNIIVSVIQLRNMLPKILFPGRDRVGKNITNLKLSDKIKVFNGMDYNNPITWFNAYKVLEEEKPDVIILQWWTSSISHMLSVLKAFAFLLNIKVVMEFHEVVDPLEEAILPIKIYSKIMGRIIKKDLSLYICHSESDKILLSERYHIDKDKIKVIPHGLYDHYKLIDKKKAKDLLNIKEEYVILFFGLIRKYKGVEYLIKAFNDLPSEILSRSRLLIVGEIWENRDQIVKQSSSPNISLINKYIQDNEINLYLSASDIIVLPYIRASQSGIAHIGMSVGKPIIASYIGGLRESLRNYDGIFFVAPFSSKDIKDKLIKNFGNDKIYNPPIDLKWNKISKAYIDVITSSSINKSHSVEVNHSDL